MEVQTFLPKYPDIHHVDDLYDLYDGEDFNDVIFRKKEFYDLKLAELPPENKPERGTLLNHQEIIARFLASHTLYDELLLYHAPGTGKTISAIGTIENVLFSNPNNKSITKAVIIVPSRGLLRKFREEIIFTATKGQYIPESIEDEETPQERRERQYRGGKKLIRPFYQLYTHDQFYKIITTTPTEQLIKNYSNSVIVLDEVHNITNSREYNAYFRFFHIIQNRKILLLTGTPIKDEPKEITKLMNLILPMELQLPIGKDFNNQLLSANNVLLPEAEQILSNAFKGRVSYLKSKTNIVYKYVGEKIPPVYFLPIYGDVMSEFQYGYYQLAYNSDTESKENTDIKRRSFYQNSRQASLFVFPNGSYGMDGYNQYVIQRRNQFFANFLDSRGSVHEKLTRLRQYSAKYANAISTIIENPDQNCFVFTESIRGGGAVLFGLCLEMFGYSRVSGSASRPGKHYAVLSSGITGTNVDKVIESFNRKTNSNGRYIQVLIGGKEIAEGFTFRNIQQIHILTPHWNFSVLDQAIARGIRAFSHRNLPIGTLVRIFLHASVYPNVDPNTLVDLKMYDMSQVKDIINKRIEYLMKVGAFDCALTYDRNVNKNGDDGSRQCEYNDCLYRCEGIRFPYMLSDNDLDKSTYQLYYDEEYTEELINLLKNIFKVQFSITLWELLDLLENKYTLFQLFSSMQNIIENNISFYDKYGFESYLQEDRNMYFLNRDVNASSYLSSYYNEYPAIRTNESFMDAVAYVALSVESLNETIQELCPLPLEQQIVKIATLPMIAQETFIENAIIAGVGSSDLTDWILNYYSDYIINKNNNIYSTFLKSSDNIVRKLSSTGWVNASKTEAANLKPRLFSNPLGIYATLKGKNKKFSIVDLRDVPVQDRELESSKRGKACSSFDKEELLEFTKYLNITGEDWSKKTKGFLCKALEKWFRTNNLIEL